MPRSIGEEGWEFLPDRRGYRGGGEVANSGICMEAVGKNCVIYFDKVNLWTVHQGGEDSEFQ